MSGSRSMCWRVYTTVPEFIDPVLGVKMIVFVKLSPKRSFSVQSVPRDAGPSLFWRRSVPEIIDPVFAKTSPKRSFSMTEYERFGLVFTKTRVWKCVDHRALSWLAVYTCRGRCCIWTSFHNKVIKLHLDLSRQQEPVLLLDVSTPQGSDLHLELSVHQCPNI